MDTDNHHFETMVGVLSNIPLLLPVFVIELLAVFVSSGLAINAQLADIGADGLTILAVAAIAGLSGTLDAAGRIHKNRHREQYVVAWVNLIALIVGLTVLLVRSILAFGVQANPGPEHSWIIVGPILAPWAYWLVQRNISLLKEKDLSVAALHVHLKADLALSVMVVFSTGLNLLFQTSWIDPVGGLLTGGFLGYFCWELLGHILGNR